MKINERSSKTQLQNKISALNLIKEELRESEEKYRLLFQTAKDAIFLTDETGRFIEVNQAACDSLGYTYEELLELSNKEIDADPRGYEAFQNVRDGLVKKITFEVNQRKKDGTLLPVEITGSFLTIGEKRISMAIAREATKRRQAEEALQESEARYRSLFEEAPISLWEEDASELKKYINSLRKKGVEDFRVYFENNPEKISNCVNMIKVLDVNKATLSLFGAKTKEELLIGLKNVFTEYSYIKFLKELVAIAEGKTYMECEDIARKLTGEEIQIHIRWSLAAGCEMTHAKRLTSITDVTERRKAENALLASEKKYSTLVEKGNDGIIIIQDGVLKFTNNMITQITGFKIKDAIGKPFIDFVTPEYQEFVMNRYKKRMSGEEVPNKYEIEIFSKDRGNISVEINASSIEYEGRPADMAIVRDITEYKQADEVIKRKTKALEESNRVKELFTDIMHHDLLNPLNIANNYVEILQKDETSPEKRSYLGIINRNLSKSMELIDNATMLSKLGSMDNIEFENLDLKRVIEEVIKNLEPLATKSEMTIENNISQSIPVKANRIIEEVFTNFLSNAIKYAANGKKIIFDYEDKNDFWNIKVIDFGEGIEDADKTGIFERFLVMQKKGGKDMVLVWPLPE